MSLTIAPLRYSADPTTFLHDRELVSLEGISPLAAVAMEHAVISLAEPIADTLDVEPDLLEEAVASTEALRAAAITGSISEPTLPLTAEEIEAADDKYALIKAKLDVDTMSHDTVSTIFEYAAGTHNPDRVGSYWMSRGSLGLVALCLMRDKTLGDEAQAVVVNELLKWLKSDHEARSVVKEARRTAPLIKNTQPLSTENERVKFMDTHGYDALFEETYTGVPTRYPALTRKPLPSDTEVYEWPNVPITDVPSFDDLDLVDTSSDTVERRLAA